MIRTKEKFDIPFKTVNGHDLLLDLYLPDAKNPPLILWTHGGSWWEGDRKWCLLKRQAQRGYAVASVDYRLSQEAPHPAQIIDCKDALAFLREHAGEYGYDASRLAVGGDSAGGHLAALLATCAGHAEWERPGHDYSVTCLVDFYGPIHFVRPWEGGHTPDSPMGQFIGRVEVLSAVGRARSADASPITYVGPNTPPVQILHGNRDPIVPIDQSYAFRNALEAAGCDVRMHVVSGGGHGFRDPVVDAIVDAFLDEHLLGIRLGEETSKGAKK